jgi:hypothetical protein
MVAAEMAIAAIETLLLSVRTVVSSPDSAGAGKRRTTLACAHPYCTGWTRC